MDLWPSAEATIVSREIVSDGIYDEGPPTARILFYYRDLANTLQGGELIVDSFTSLYRVEKDDRITIQFNPRRPAIFYSSEAASWFTNMRSVFWLLFVLITAVGLAASFLDRS